MAGVIIAIVVIINKILHPSVPVGWSSTLCVMVVFFGVVLMVLGVVGEYLGKIIMILNNTPQYIVRETINAADNNDMNSVIREIVGKQAEKKVEKK